MRHLLALALWILSPHAHAEETPAALTIASPDGLRLELKLDEHGEGELAWVEDGRLWRVSAARTADGEQLTLRWRHHRVRPIRVARETTVDLPLEPRAAWKVERVTVDATRHQFTLYVPDEQP